MASDPPRVSHSRRRSLPRPQTARSNKQRTMGKAGGWPHLGSVAKKLPGLFVADLLQQLLPVVDVLFVLLRGEPVLRPPAFERLLFRRAAVTKLLQDLLAVRTQEKISHENRAMGIGGPERDGGAADIVGHKIHRQPFDWRTFGRREPCMALKNRRRGNDFAGGNHVDQRWRIDRKSTRL